MEYMLIHCVDESLELSDDEVREVQASLASWLDEMIGRGIDKSGARLQPARTATTVRARGGEVLVADGPFAETKEQIGGYDIVEVADLDEAIEVASKHPVARIGTVEVRPLFPS